MTSFERIAGLPAAAAACQACAGGDAATTAQGVMAGIGARVLAWTSQSFGTNGDAAAAWNARTGAQGGFAPDRAELARGGDVYDLRGITAGIAREYGATPAQEGALGRAIEDFTRGVALRFNALADGGARDAMLDGVAGALDDAVASGGPDGIEGVTTRIELAARAVDTANR